MNSNRSGRITINLSRIASNIIFIIIGFVLLFFAGYGIIMFNNDDVNKLQLLKLYLFLVSLAIISWTSYKGIEIDLEQFTIKNYYSILGIKIGNKKHFEKPIKIILTRTVRSEITSYRGQSFRTYEELFIISFVYFGDKYEKICVGDRKSEIQKSAKTLATRLNIPFEEYE